MLGESMLSEWRHRTSVGVGIRSLDIVTNDFIHRTVAALGSAVKSFKVGERIAGFHEMDTPNGSYAEYAVCPEQTVFRIPDSMSDEEAATIPLAIFTASVALYRNIDIPAPWDRSDEKAASTEKVPLVVNGASGQVGAFAIKLAKMNARVGPIIAIAGSSADFVKSLGVDAIVDYRSDSVAEDIKRAAGGLPIRHAFDAANSVKSVKYLIAVLEKGGRYTCTTPTAANAVTGSDGTMDRLLDEAGIWHDHIWCGEVHETKKPGGQMFGAVMSRVIERALANGTLEGHPYREVEGGLNGVKQALEDLKNGKRGDNKKYVTRIDGTAGGKGGAKI